jgi:hypothetical protein
MAPASSPQSSSWEEMQLAAAPTPSSSKQVIGAADRMQEAGGDAAVGDAMGLGRLIQQQRQR